MLSLLKNEMIKLHLRKKFLVSVLVFAALSALICISISLVYKYATSQSVINAQENLIKQTQEELDKETDEAKKKDLSNQLASQQLALNNLKNRSEINNDNWKEKLQEQIDSTKNSMENASESDGSKENIRKELIRYQYMLDHNIKYSDDTKPSGINMLLNIIESLGPLFIVIIIAIMASDIVSSEYTPPTMKVLLTRPISRAKLLASKFLAAIIANVAVIIGIEILVTLIMGVIYGFGDFSSPIAVGTKYKSVVLDASSGSTMVAIYGSSYLISSGKFLLEVLLYQILFIAAVTSFFLLLSAVIKSSALSMTLGVILPIAINIAGIIKYFKVIKPFIFTAYGDQVSVLNSSTIATSSNIATPLGGIIVLIVWLVASYAIAHRVFTKQDMLI
ncbi:ABC transporter permease subunit [Clostridium sp. 19966]|uniref:ABC transporter permease subunit n=1 Tax=Clostridium sp. 19966 TaxID=2768166 RepID=UPI0028DF40A1|nr:ABC transporter permease subunit [Clostridium sp. 19966]MDT8719048.1 ABC transporter permease subunit [Clostridium sp. 19966]